MRYPQTEAEKTFWAWFWMLFTIIMFFLGLWKTKDTETFLGAWLCIGAFAHILLNKYWEMAKDEGWKKALDHYGVWLVLFGCFGLGQLSKLHGLV